MMDVPANLDWVRHSIIPLRSSANEDIGGMGFLHPKWQRDRSVVIPVLSGESRPDEPRGTTA
jgi:hypothetical protein